jgi:hypothetical protein
MISAEVSLFPETCHHTPFHDPELRVVGVTLALYFRSSTKYLKEIRNYNTGVVSNGITLILNFIKISNIQMLERWKGKHKGKA